MRTLFISMTIVAAAFLTIPPTQAQQRPPQAPDEIIDLECDPEFGYLRTVRRDEVEAIDDSYEVSIWPVCVGDPDPGVALAGNAAGLHNVIAENDTLSAALAEEGYDANDVAGIRFGARQSVILYVHRVH